MKLIIAPVLLAFGISSASAAAPDFAKDIQPIFAEYCTECHGPDKQKAGLNLANPASLRAELKSGEHAMMPGKPGQSALIYRLTTTDADEQMPPPEKGKPLPAKDIAKIRRWIAEGGKWTQHWAYRPLDSKPLAVNGKTPARNQIDWFIYAKLKMASVAPSPAADRADAHQAACRRRHRRHPYPVSNDVREDAPFASARCRQRHRQIR